MWKKTLLGILGFFVGMAVGMVVNMGLVQLNMAMHAPPEGMNTQDREQFKAYVATLPVLGFLVVLLAHQGQAFVGAIVGTLIAGRRSVVVALAVGAFTLLGCVLMLFMAPGPIWFAVLDVLLPLPLAWLGARLVMRKD